MGRSRLASLVCELLVVPQFPAGLIGPLLELQTQLWPQDTIRCGCDDLLRESS